MIPNTATFVYIGDMPFSYVHAVAVVSAAHVGGYDTIRLLCDRRPTGPWWDRCADLVQVERITPPEEVFGVPLRHPAHVTDVVRMHDMLGHGGVYLDLDVLSVAPVPDKFADSSCVLGEQRLETGVQWGLGCAVMLCEPESPFVRTWYEGYDPARSQWEGFRSGGRDPYWSEMSTRYPAMLALRSAAPVTVVSHEVFYPFNWEPEGLDRLFAQDLPLPDRTLALHLWEASSWDRYLARLGPAEVAREDTTFTRACRAALDGCPVPGLLG